ncbi:MAG: anti-sigma factor [Dehalococcoidia bacterium]
MRRLHSFVDGNLDATGAASVERHLAGCDRCQALQLELRGLRSALRALPAHEAPRSFRLTLAMAGAGASSTARSSSRQSVLPWIQNGSRAVGAVAAAALAVLVFVDIGPGVGSNMSSKDTASLAASAGEAAAGQAPESASPAFAQDSAAAPKVTEAVPTFDGSQVTAQAAPDSPGSESLPEPPADDQALTPEPEIQQVSRYDEAAAQELAPSATGGSTNWLLRGAQIALGGLAAIAIAASFLVPSSKRKASSR